jgi:hypothetical protein
MSAGEPDATESGHVRFGGGTSEKDLINRHLAGVLPNGTYGSEGAPMQQCIGATRRCAFGKP